MESIKDKTILITGAAGGIGYKYAEKSLQHGAKKVAILDLVTSSGKSSAENLEKEFGKGRVIFIPCDVTNLNELKESFDKVVKTFGGLDILINNAGIVNDVQLEQTISVNITALIRGTLLAIDYMGKHKGGKGGTVVNIASVVGLHPAKCTPIYTATKHAVIGFCNAIKNFHKKTGVRVLVMCPGLTDTPLVTNIEQRTLDFIDPEEVVEEVKSYPRQSADHVADAMIDLIQKGKNGAVWVSEGGQPPYAVDFPHYSKRSVPV